MKYRILGLIVASFLAGVSPVLGQYVDFTGTITSVQGTYESYDTGGTVYTLSQSFPGPSGGDAIWSGSGGFTTDGSHQTVQINGGDTLVWDQNGFVPSGGTFVLGQWILLENSIDLGTDPTATRQIDLGMSTSSNGPGPAEIIDGPITGSGNLLLQNYSQTSPPSLSLNPTLYEEGGISISGQMSLNNVYLWDGHYPGEPGVSATAYILSDSGVEANITGTPDMTMTNGSYWLLNSMNTGDHSVGNLNGDATSDIDFGLGARGGTVTLTVHSGYFAGALLTDNANSGVWTQLVKDGPGIFTLAGNNTTYLGSPAFTGAIDVKQGTLLVAGTSGSATGTGPVTVESGGSFGGTGTITPGGFEVMSGGKLDLSAYDPAHPPTSQITKLTLTLSPNYTAVFDAGAAFVFDLGTPGRRTQLGQSDLLSFTSGEVTFNDNAVSFNLLSGVASGTYTLFSFADPSEYVGTLQNGSDYHFNYNPESITVTFTGTVPEPSTWGALILGLSLLRLVTWRAGSNSCQRKNGMKIA